MAAALEVSASYVNLIERNQRPVSAELLLKVARAFDIDLGRFADAGIDGLADALKQAFTDPLFHAAGVDRDDADDIVIGNPSLAGAILTLFRSWKSAQNDLAEAGAEGRLDIDDPVEEARAFLQERRNYFDELDRWAEQIATALSAGALGRAVSIEAIAARFLERHRLTVRVLPDEVMGGDFRRLDRHSGTIAVSERLDHASRVFHLCLQMALLEQGGSLDRAVNAGRFQSDSGRRLARNAVANYAAAAIMLPYARFFASAQELRYDVEALGRRFGASFEQVAHRLTTLRRAGAEGVAFYFLRIDSAGNVSKRFAGDVFSFARYGGPCPLWNIHDSFRTPRRIISQIVELEDRTRYLSIARTVYGGIGGHGSKPAERAVTLGCRIEDAGALVYADGLDLTDATPIGLTCRLCERTACAARAHPPIRRPLIIDEHRRAAAPFRFAFD